MPISTSVKMKLAGDVFRNVFTGHYEPSKPTDPDRTEQRRQNIVKGCQDLLEAVVGRGDLLDSETRAEFAKEAYASVNLCDGCKGVPCLRDSNQFVTFNEKSASHTYVSKSPFRDIAHAIVNNQDKLNEALFDAFVERIQDHYKGQNKTKDDCVAMAVEFAIIAASCAGVHDIYVGAGMELPPLPPCTPQQPYFAHVSDYSLSPLRFDKDIAWGPYLLETDCKPEVVKEHNFDAFLHSFRGNKGGPTSKSSAVPITSYKWMEFMTVTYFEPACMGFFDVPGKDRHLSRAQIELASATYNNTKHCSF